MSNPYLEKIAALGEIDYLSAVSDINKKRISEGKEKLDANDPTTKAEFLRRRGSSGRVVGTLLGTPLAPVGWVGGYYLGKSHDNRKAGERFKRQYESQ